MLLSENKTNDLSYKYLEATIFNFTREIERKYNIEIDFGSLKSINDNEFTRNEVGIMILLRRLAKRQLEMSNVQYQRGKIEDSINNLLIAIYLTEDNILKTIKLYQLIKAELSEKVNKQGDDYGKSERLSDQLYLLKDFIISIEKHITEAREFKKSTSKTVQYE
jgi:hypothetical protein